MINWIELYNTEDVFKIIEISKQSPVIIFKHSTRCPISSSAYNSLQYHWKEDEMKDVQTFYLDVISSRSVSYDVAQAFHVPHESPQILIIKNGSCIFAASHSRINYNKIKEMLVSA